MTDDQTRPIETTPPPTPEPAVGLTPDEAAPVAPAPTSAPVAAPRAPGASRTRWAVGLGVAGLAIVGAIAAFVLFGAQSSPEALRYVPGDAAFVAELRLDLPGDQLQKVGNLLAHFPGFADQSTLAAKVDEALGKVVTSASEGKASYVTDIKPWVNGPLFVGVLGEALDAMASGPGSTPTGMIISATTNGAAACPTTTGGQAVTHEAYKNLDLVISADKALACVLDGRQALLGDPATVKKALDAKAAGTGIDKSASYQKARSALGGDRLATIYANGASLQRLMPKPADLGVPGIDALIGSLPEWIMGGVRAEDDALVVDYVSAVVPAATAGPSLLPLPAAHGSLITGQVPGSTLVYIEAQGAGVGLQNLLTMLGGIPDLQAPLQMLDGLGGGGELVGWIDDVGLAISTRAATADVALLLVGKDETAVSTRVGSLKALLTLAGSGGVTASETTINGTAVTSITITDLGSILPPGTIPGGTLPSSTGPITFSLAAHGRTLIVTSGEAAMTAILNTAAGSSLADQAAFKQASARGIANSRTTVYVGVGAAVDLAKGFLPADALAKYQAEVAPYLDPLEAMLINATSDASGNRSRIVMTVTKP